MKKKKSKFLTFIFSLLPGAGHMYMGFMKTGISFMAMFFFLIFLSSWLDIGPLLFILPLIWFYSFFDCINKAETNDDEFTLLEDNYLFSMDKLVSIDKDIFKKRRLFLGILLLLLGIYLAWNNVMNILSRYITAETYNIIRNITRITPQLIIGIAIIILGVKLIIGKKKECDNNG